MDIANYIGLFLLKNRFCYVHGLGNMEVKKRPATYDGNALQSPSYEVVVTQGGSIDDSLANFIATGEQISISKAANALREYSTQARKDMAAGKEVAIPNIGKLIEENGKVSFRTDPNFQYTPAGIPTIRNSRQLDEQNEKIVNKPVFPVPHKANSVNWSMIILVFVLLIILGGGGYGIYYYTHDRSGNTTITDTVVKTQAIPTDTTSNVLKDTTTQVQPPTDTNQVNAYKMVIGNYNTEQRAERRIKALTMNGNHVEMQKQDSVNFLVITTINCRATDTLHTEDSLRSLFGYKEVVILK